MKKLARYPLTIALIGLALAGTASVLTPSVAAQARGAGAKDPLVGTWDLDKTKSTYTGAPAGAAPYKRDMTFETVPMGYKHTTVTRDVLGAANPSEYTAKFDGKDYPAPADSALDTNSIKRIDATTIERTGKIKGMVIETVTYQVSADGKTLTVTQKGNYNGADYSSLQIFTKRN